MGKGIEVEFEYEGMQLTCDEETLARIRDRHQYRDDRLRSHSVDHPRPVASDSSGSELPL